MSRSYKKTPYAGDCKGKIAKRFANKAVRNYLKKLSNDHPDNGSYKKLYETWDICDYYWIETWEDYWNETQKRYAEHPEWYKNPPNEKEEYRKWYRTYKMK